MWLAPIFIILVLVLNFFFIRSTRSKKPFEEFAENQRQANTARKQEIPQDIYLTPDKEALPIHGEYDEANPRTPALIRTRESVVKKIDKPMLRLPEGMDNNEVKIAYGVSNFEKITACEENYNAFVRALVNWGKELVTAKMFDDAQAVLNESIRLRSDLSLSYTLLFDLYKETGDKAGLKRLTQLVQDEDFMAHNAATRDKIRKYII